jgi:hypothetical protein
MATKDELRAEIVALQTRIGLLLAERERLVGDIIDAREEIATAEQRAVGVGRELLRLEIERLLRPNQAPRTGAPPLPFPLLPPEVLRSSEPQAPRFPLDWYDGEVFTDEC